MILITEFMDEAAVERLKAARPTSYAPQLADRPEELASRVDGVQALIVRNRTQVTAALLDAASRLRVVGRLGVGLDNIDLDACKALGVEVIPAIGANALSVAEYVVTNALALLRGAYQANARMLVGDWPRADCSGREASGRRLGLIGFGANGQETARLAQALGMQVMAFDPMLPREHPAWQGIQAASLDDVMEQADVISLHVPLTDQTRHLINADRLA
ncbi:MAG: 3-phosphoglycerate dehydrogenase, partial [Boseongicola sp. SB0675_bin_26]|nr:3-phosphoglycerate dehydrogenase [Boseongicola sp. SB0675_bin_26]